MLETLDTDSITSDIGDDLYHTLPLQAYRYQEYKSGNITGAVSMIIKELNDVDEKALSMTLDTMVSRHESLRTVFLSREGTVLHKVCSVDTFIPALSIESIVEQDNRDEKMKKIVDDLSNYSFDFENEPSFKCKLIKFSEDRYIFIFVIDHIIYDAHSLRLIENELYTIYNAYLQGLPNPLQPLNKQLKDFVNSYRTHYEGDKLTYHKAYFQDLFKDMPEKLKIRPCDNDAENNVKVEKADEMYNPGSLGYSAVGEYRFVVPENILEKIQRLSFDWGVSFFNFVLASYSVFLSLVTFQKDFLIDSPMSTRGEEDHLKIIGWLTGTLATRIKVDENASFSDLLSVCTDEFFDAVNHIYYQAGDSVLSPEWFQEATQLNFLNDPNTAKGIIEDFHPYHFDRDKVAFRLTFLIEAFKNGLVVTCLYKKNFIDKRQIPVICQKFLEVLHFATNSPNVKIKDWTTGKL